MNEKVLLDECVFRRLKPLFSDFSVSHVKDPQIKLDGIVDSKVLKETVERKHGFNVFVTTERKIHQQIGDAKNYKLGVVVINFEGRKPNKEKIASLMPQIKEAIKQVKQGEMLHVYASSGQIEKVTHKQLLERDRQQKAQKEQRGQDKKAELAEWQKQRPQGVTPNEWGQEFGKRKQEEHRKNRAEQEQQMHQKI